ncbi:hypothetical protein FQZ97_949710 [compost metagenome]
MLNASINILCRNLTTGASSTSEALSVASFTVVSVATSSNSKSPPMMLSIVSLTLVVWVSTSLLSLSYSAMTQSTPICVANLIFSAAC